jgi:solute carrier family 32 (vesicular inhibitory amino acid transporter)
MNVRLQALTHIGGVNSMSRFAASWQRAAGFHEVAPIRPSFRLADADDDGPHDEEHAGEYPYVRKSMDPSPEQQGRSLLREAFENYGRRMSDNAVDTSDEPHNGASEDATEHTPLRIASSSRLAPPNVPSSWADSIFSLEPSLASGFGGSYGTMYASRASRAQPRPVPNISEVFRDEAVKIVPEGPTEEGPEQAPLLIKQIEEEGVTYTVVVGQSTLPQTVFNSVNVLIGVGLLSLPLGLLYSGWVVGIIFMIFSGLATQYTAKLLAKCLDVDNSLITFADLAYVSFGKWARLAVSMLFCVELIAACVALVILFSDSLSALLPGLYDGITWKIICGVLLIPLSFLPLRLLSFTSVLGILSCLGSELLLLLQSAILTL